jgi:hypothetical protein
MTPVNPYVHGKPLPHDSEIFFDRRSELDNISSLLSTEQRSKGYTLFLCYITDVTQSTRCQP